MSKATAGSTAAATSGIVRAPRPKSQYTQIRNEVLRDQRLSFRALGVLLEILSRPDNWHTRSEHLAAGRKEGRDAVRTALAELRAAGYMRIEKVRGDRGRISTISYVYDEPQERVASTTGAEVSPGTDCPAPVKPAPGGPESGQPEAGGPGPFRTHETNTLEELTGRTSRAKKDDFAGASSSDRFAAEDEARKKIEKTKRRTAGRYAREHQRALNILDSIGYEFHPDEITAFLRWLRDVQAVANPGAYCQGVIDNDGEDKLADLVCDAQVVMEQEAA